MNNVTLVGRLTKDVELRYTQSGKAVANFNLAVNRSFRTQDGQDADFINCQSWGKTAENLAQYMKKGSQIGVTGRIQTRSFENKEGNRVFVTEVVAENVTFLESKKSSNQSNNQSSEPNENPFENEGDEVDGELPF